MYPTCVAGAAEVAGAPKGEGLPVPVPNTGPAITHGSQDEV